MEEEGQLTRRCFLVVAALLGAAMASGACDSREVDRGGDGSLGGDTLVVRSTPGAEAVTGIAPPAVVTITGHAPDDPFGQLVRLVAAPDGGVIVLDSKADGGAVIRRFSADGSFLNNIGQSGEGRGEYSSRRWANIAVNKNGIVSVRDARAMVHQYRLDGTLIGEFTYYSPRREASGAVYPAADNSVYLEARYDTEAHRVLFVRVDDKGKVLDEIVDDGLWLPPGPRAFRGIREMRFPVHGNRIVHVGSEQAGFLMTSLTAGAKPLIAEVEVPSIAYSPEERKEIRAVSEWRARMFPPEDREAVAEMPELKPVSHGFGFSDLDDRVWVYLSSAAQKFRPKKVAQINKDSVTVSYWEPTKLAVFRFTGEFLGVVRFPINAVEVAATGNAVWALMVDEDDTQLLVKFRLDGFPLSTQ